MFLLKFQIVYYKYIYFLLYFLWLHQRPLFNKLTIFTLKKKIKTVKILKSPHVNKKSIETFKRFCYVYFIRIQNKKNLFFFLIFLKKLSSIFALNISYKMFIVKNGILYLKK